MYPEGLSAYVGSLMQYQKESPESIFANRSKGYEE
jgi:hypothetical protein